MPAGSEKKNKKIYYFVGHACKGGSAAGGVFDHNGGRQGGGGEPPVFHQYPLLSPTSLSCDPVYLGAIKLPALGYIDYTPWGRC